MRNVILLFLLIVGWTTTVYAQNEQETIEVTGIVTDPKNEPLIGVNVTARNMPGFGAITDINGRYKIKVPNYSYLIFSYVGFTKQEIFIKDKKIINIVMAETKETVIDEVVVTGTGAQKKVTVTGAVTTVDVSQLRTPTASITNALAGNVAGILARQTSGQPGSNISEFWIRGISTFGAGGSALVLVDGFERDMNEINVEDIQDFSVLKDASSTAVFGVRGANGVILITTRRGKSGKTQISASTKLGLQQPISLVEQTGSYEFARFWNMKQEMDHVTNPKLYFTPEQIEAYRTGSDPIMYPNMDWKKYIFHNLYLQSQNNVNISGGNDNVQYFVSVGYTYQNGLLKELPGQLYDNNYRYNRYNYRANIDANLTKTTTMKLGVGGVLGKIQEPRDVQSGTGNDPNAWVIAQIWSHPFAGPGFINGVRTLVPDDLVPLGEVMRDGMFVFYGKGYNQTYDTTLNMDLDITQKLDFVTPGLSVSVKGAYDNQFKLYKERAGGAIESQTVYYQSYFDSNGNMPQPEPDYDNTHIFVPSGSYNPLTY